MFSSPRASLSPPPSTLLPLSLSTPSPSSTAPSTPQTSFSSPPSPNPKRKRTSYEDSEIETAAEAGTDCDDIPPASPLSKPGRPKKLASPKKPVAASSPKGRGGKPASPKKPAAATPSPKQRGQKPKSIEDEGPKKKKRGRPAKTEAVEPTTPATTEASETSSTTTCTPSPTKKKIPASPRLSTTLTKAECEYVFGSVTGDWKKIVNSINDKYGQKRNASAVKRHWEGFVKKAVVALYKE